MTTPSLRDAEPLVVREELGTIHSPDKCGVIEGWMLKIASAVGLDITQGITGSQVLDAIEAMRKEKKSPQPQKAARW